MSFLRIMARASLSGLAVIMIFHPFSTVSASAVGGTEQATRGGAKSLHLQVANRAHVLQRVFAAGVLDLAVVQQPVGNQTFVSTVDDQATQFSLASRYGNIGLLAHNYLAGKSFPELTIGTKVRVVYSDGKVESYVVSQILRYQALRPESPFSSFRNLTNDQTLSAAQLFARVYAEQSRLVFQTCIARFGNLSWGRLFVIAVPSDEFVDSPRPMSTER